MTKKIFKATLICALSFAGSGLLYAQAGSQSDILWATAENGFSQPAESRGETADVYPEGIVSLSENTKYLIWVELNSGRLNLIERLGDKNYHTLKTIPISIGKNGFGKEIEGDKKTPVGVYRVTRYIDDEELIDFYGLGAYPINYPNAWDKLQDRTGYGIWLHGLPKGVDERPLLDSDGCVVVDNESLVYLDDFIAPGNTIVVLGDDLEWVERGPADDSNAVMRAIESWKTSWESLDANRYLNNYHPEFSDLKRNFDSWSEYKTRVNSAKSFIKVDISKLSVIHYPGAEDLISVHFYQEYESSNYSWSGWKELLWRKDADGRWKIAFEGNG